MHLRKKFIKKNKYIWLTLFYISQWKDIIIKYQRIKTQWNVQSTLNLQSNLAMVLNDNKNGEGSEEQTQEKVIHWICYLVLYD